MRMGMFVGSGRTTWMAGAVLLLTGLTVMAAPTANNQTGTVATEDIRRKIASLSANSSGSFYKYMIMSLPVHGTLEYKDGAGVWRAYVAGTPVTYENNGMSCYFTPEAGYLGADSFTWKVADPQTNWSGVATYSLMIVSNTVPKANNSTLTVPAGVRKTCSLNYTEPDSGQILAFMAVTVPAHGSLTRYDSSSSTYPAVTAGAWISTSGWYYQPVAGYSGSDSFTWKMSDGITNSNVGTISITITPNTAPVAYDQKRILIKNQQVMMSAWYTDPDGQTMTPTIVTPPAHGSVSTQSSAFIYKPGTNYVGTDSFTWRISDGVASSGVATCSILTREVNSRAGMTVLLVVRSTILPEITSEVNRLKADMENEGYAAKIISFTGSSAADVMNILKSEYAAAGQCVTGAILIGNMPTHSKNADTYYWEVEDISPSVLDPRLSLWVSRIWATGFSGGEVKRIKWALDANHAYRTGASRLPWTTYCYDAAGGNQRVPSVATNIYAVPAEVVHPDTALTRGGEIMDEESHNDGWVGGNAASGHPSQIRYGLFSSCSSGRLGGPVNQNLMRYGGGNILSLGAYTTTYETAYELFANKTVFGSGDTASFCRRLAAGDAWGSLSVDMFIWETMVTTGMWYGDLSLGVKRYPSNSVPVIASMTADKTSGAAPLTATLSAAVRDPDGSIASCEWFINGFNGGYSGPTFSGASTSLTHTFTLAHRYPVEVQAVDNYMARAWASKEIVVGPETGKPVRVRCGKNFAYYTPGWDYTNAAGDVWLHDQAFAAGTWGYSGGNEGYVNAVVSNTADDAVFQYFRSGSSFTYKVPVTNGAYWLNLCFADMQSSGAGQRVADVDVEGVNLMSGLDVCAQMGPKTAGVLPLYVEVVDGELTFTVRKNAASPNDVFLNCFEVAAYSGGNRPPLAQGQSVSVWKNTAKAIALVASDEDGDAMTYSIVGQPAHGALSGTPPNVVYTPATDYAGTDSFTFKANDGKADGNVALVSIAIGGMVSHWKLDETTGTVAVESVGANNGTLVGGPAWSVGKAAGGLLFDGLDDNVAVANGPYATVSGAFTMSMWVNPAAGRTVTTESISGTAGTSGQRYAIYPTQGDTYGTGHAGAGISVGTNGVSVFEHAGGYLPSPLVYGATLTNWTHLAVVYQGGTPKLYVNGTLVRTGVASAKIVHPGCAMGGSSYGWFKGTLDDVRICNVALTADEIAALAVGQNNGVDASGIPDSWKVLHFGSAAAVGSGAMDDPDHDGMNNLAEFISGTNPRDVDSGFRIQGSGYQAGAFGLGFQTVTGRLYSVMYLDDLLGTDWNLLTNNIHGTGGQVQIQDSNAAGKRFYRIGVKLE
ncbi:MAG: hypothetical protein C0404_11390 [Verrucomicrobia bacterium]|nr:hypothetical protein [Verrucomicrobiota bacterium]